MERESARLAGAEGWLDGGDWNDAGKRGRGRRVGTGELGLGLWGLGLGLVAVGMAGEAAGLEEGRGEG